jgi:DNA recombination protein RmuC
MSEMFAMALLAGIVIVILLQVLALWRGNRDTEGERRLRSLQEAQEKGLERLERELREELARGRREDAEEAFRDREERAQSATLLGQAVTTQVGQFGSAQSERLEAFARELNRFSLGLDERFERLKTTVESRLTAIQADNAGKLEEMRRTVDEKLHATLEQRLGESFKLVSERLEQVHRGLGEMQSLAAGVGDLKRVLSNVKTRGTWGEVQLSALLERSVEFFIDGAAHLLELAGVVGLDCGQPAFDSHFQALEAFIETQ